MSYAKKRNEKYKLEGRYEKNKLRRTKRHWLRMERARRKAQIRAQSK